MEDVQKVLRELVGVCEYNHNASNHGVDVMIDTMITLTLGTNAATLSLIYTLIVQDTNIGELLSCYTPGLLSRYTPSRDDSPDFGEFIQELQAHIIMLEEQAQGEAPKP